MMQGTAYWTDLFVRHFLFEDGRSAQESDDLLFFIRKRHIKESRKYIPRYEASQPKQFLSRWKNDDGRIEWKPAYR